MNISESNRNLLDELYSCLKEYFDLRINESKLSVVESLSVLFSRLIVFMLAVMTGAIAFAFFAFAFSLWLGTVLGSQAIGALITGGIFLIAMTTLIIFRKKLFADSMVRLLIGMLFKDRQDETSK
jgi:hypothetical protein